jgi:hypothetical protein
MENINDEYTAEYFKKLFYDKSDDSNWSVALFVNYFLMKYLTNNDSYDNKRKIIMTKIDEFEKMVINSLVKLNSHHYSTEFSRYAPAY